MKVAPTLEEIYSPVQSLLRTVPSAILDILAGPNELATDVVRYFFAAQGKLLRPALTFWGAGVRAQETVKEDDRLVRLAAAFEIFHAATLIHDDIIDSAYLRRSVPTVNVKWGPEVAVLVGDYLHDKAIGTIFQNGNEKIVSAFLHTAGVVCDGEIHELKEKDNFNLTEEEYLEIVEKKTASLLGCAVAAGGVLAGTSAEETEALKRYGRYFGTAFQIVDDCLDFTGQEQEFGKTLGADCAAGVLTLPLIRLIRLVDEKKKSEVFKIFKSEMGTKFQILLEMIREYGTIEESMQKAHEFCEKARLELSIFPETPAKKSLLSLTEYVLVRHQ